METTEVGARRHTHGPNPFVIIKALQYADDTHGWQIGAGPTVAIVNAGLEADLTTTQLTSDSYAYVFGQQGLMAGVTVEGSKVTRIQK